MTLMHDYVACVLQTHRYNLLYHPWLYTTAIFKPVSPTNVVNPNLTFPIYGLNILRAKQTGNI